jgi:hypothetical protein
VSVSLVTITGASSALAAPPKVGVPRPVDTTQAAPEAAAPEAAPAVAPETPPAAEPTAPAGTETAASIPPSEDDITNTAEDPDRRYYFLGLRYRGTIIPKFLMNIFVDEGTTTYSNTFGVELDMRKGGQSMIPWLVYTEYGMGDTLFHQKATDTTIPGNYSVVSSGLKSIYLGLDELWSTPIDQSHHWDFEFGFGVGVGILFGDLVNNWVYVDNSGPLVASTGVHYRTCHTELDGPGCARMNHQNAQIAKINNYKEPFWSNGGSVPNIFPNVWFPTFGVRYKPIKELQARLGVGFSLTGFWFGLGLDYGFETPEDKGTMPTKPKASLRSLRDML